MANPQLEDGFTRIANETIEHLARTRIPGVAMQVLFTIIRKTYGFRKKADRIALSQFVTATGLKKPTIIKALKKLENMNIIVTNKDNAKVNEYRINKDFDKWKPLPKKITLPIKVTGVTNNGNSSLPKKIIPYTKENTTKETITKEREKARAKQYFFEFNSFLNNELEKIWDNFVDLRYEVNTPLYEKEIDRILNEIPFDDDSAIKYLEKLISDIRDGLSDNDKPKKRFVKPTPEEVEEYGREIGFDIDGQKFINHYDQINWMKGNSKITNWKASVRSWQYQEAQRKSETKKQEANEIPEISGTKPPWEDG